MTTSLQLDSYHFKCKWCGKLHIGRTQTLDFNCIREQMLEHGRERIHKAIFSSVCDCDQPISITFMVREYPEDIFTYQGYQSADAEILIAPNVREHMNFVDV